MAQFELNTKWQVQSLIIPFWEVVTSSEGPFWEVPLYTLWDKDNLWDRDNLRDRDNL
jgi:hypothetical protein